MCLLLYVQFLTYSLVTVGSHKVPGLLRKITFELLLFLFFFFPFTSNHYVQSQTFKNCLWSFFHKNLNIHLTKEDTDDKLAFINCSSREREDNT